MRFNLSGRTFYFNRIAPTGGGGKPTEGREGEKKNVRRKLNKVMRMVAIQKN